MPDPDATSALETGFALVLEVARDLAAPCPLPELLTKVIDGARALLQADRGSVFLYDDKTHELYMISGTGIESLRFSATLGLAGECATTQKLLNIPDCYADPRFNREIDRKTGYRTQCLLSVPLMGLQNRLVGVMQLLNSAKGSFDERDQTIAIALGAQAGVAIQRQQLLEVQQIKQKMERDLLVARDIQRGVLPARMPDLRGYEIACYNRPADETGGDIYDVAHIAGDNDSRADANNPVVLLLADATGHGIGPALSVTQVRAMFRMGLRLGASLGDVVQRIDQQLYDDLGGSRFVTAFVGVLDPQNNQLEYQACGQGPLLFYHRAEDRFDFRAATGLPLGIMPDLPGDEVDPVPLQPGDWVVLLTDGFYECMGPTNDQFGEERVAELVRKHRDEAPQVLIEALLAALDEFAYQHGVTQADDLTAIVLRRTL